MGDDMDTREPPPTEPRRDRAWRPAAIVALVLFVLAGAALVVGAAVVVSGFYTVDIDEVAVVVRLGEPPRVLEPGSYFKLPAPIDRVYKVPVLRLLRQEFGVRSDPGDPVPADLERDMERESHLVTGDLGVAVVQWSTSYSIRDPLEYVFGLRDVEATFRSLNEAVMSSVVGDRSIDEVVTIGRLEIEDEVTARLQELSDRLGAGLLVEQVVLRDVNPPAGVKPSFDEVNAAELDRERTIRGARAAVKARPPGGA
jgi:membrane protease subunit HflK